MTVVTETISVKAAVADVFEAYVERIDAWWPRQGKRFRYSFAPKGVDPHHIRFEPRVGGRLYETFSDGSEYVIGAIREYAPPDRIAYTWKAPDWNAETLVDVTFEKAGETTIVRVRHTGFEKLGQPGLAAGYQEGSREIYAALQTWLEAAVPSGERGATLDR